LCFLHGWGGAEFNRETVPGISHDTYFGRGGRLHPWRPQEKDFQFMRANGSALTALGWDQLAHYRARGTAMAVKPHDAADGIRAAVIRRPAGGPLTVGLTSPDAAILGGKIEYPCTDLGLGVGALAPGATASVTATAWFIKGGLEEFWSAAQLRRH
jgi:hypothetical protein